MSDAMTALCPGQGAQAVGMGSDWAQASPQARAIFDQADAILAESADALPGDAPLSTLCFQGPAEVLNQTDVAQPAIFATSVACWHGLLAQRDPGSAVPAFAAGLSLGEYTALHLAGAISFRDGLRLVALRGRAMQDAARAADSGMLALIGADEDQALAVCEHAARGEVLVCANFNAPGQIVLSGASPALDRAQSVAADQGLRCARLPVAGAFHSPLMQPAADRLATALAQTPIEPPRCPVLANVTGLPHEPDPERIRRLLVDQLTQPVRWSSCCEWLASHATAPLHELAPGKTLAGLMRRIDRTQKVTTHDTP